MTEDRIWTDVTFSANGYAVTIPAIIDTGATLSFVPQKLVSELALRLGDIARPIRWANGSREEVESTAVEVSFPGLTSTSRRIAVAVSKIHADPIIGMDVMVPLGIKIDTGTGKVDIANKIWDAAKTLTAMAGAAALFWKGYELLVGTDEPKPSPSPVKGADHRTATGKGSVARPSTKTTRKPTRKKARVARSVKSSPKPKVPKSAPKKTSKKTTPRKKTKRGG